MGTATRAAAAARAARQVAGRLRILFSREPAVQRGETELRSRENGGWPPRSGRGAECSDSSGSCRAGGRSASGPVLPRGGVAAISVIRPPCSPLM